MTTESLAARKSLARILDRAAARAGDNAATAAQTWYLAGSMIEAGDDGDEYLLNTSIRLSRRDASSMIDHFVKPAAPVAPAPAPVAAAPIITPPAGPSKASLVAAAYPEAWKAAGLLTPRKLRNNAEYELYKLYNAEHSLS